MAEKDGITETKGNDLWVENLAENHDVDDHGDPLKKAEDADLGANLMASGHVQITQAELEELESKLPEMPAEEARKVLDEIYTVHQHDPRYDPQTLERIRMFLFDPEILANPELYKELIFEMRIFALLTTTSSAYPEVRAVATNTDDPTLPTLTIRVWIIGTFFSAIGCVINSIFSLRYPSVAIGQNVVQLIAYPCGLAMAKWLPKKTILGVNLNPGPFNKKEHMLIVIMSGLGMSWPPLQHLVFVQAMPQYYNMEWARKPGYQFLGSLGTNMIGFGFAGLTRRFLVYPSYCVWPFSLSTIALNNALHDHGSKSSYIPGPFGTRWKASMYKCFWVVFIAYFVYYFFPGYMFPNLTIFDWMSWIKPTNGKLVAITSLNFGVGLGFNPFPTFDYNYLANPGGYYPMFVHYNFLAGLTVALLLSIIFYYRNAWNTGYLMIASPSTFDNKGNSYKVTSVTDSMGRIIEEKYQQYSEPYMSATRIVSFIGSFAYTTGTLTHTLLYNRHELKMGWGSLWKDFKRFVCRIRGQDVGEEDDVHFGDDIHYRLMQAYPEVPEWWFTIVAVVFMILSMVCLGVYTDVNPAVVLMAPAMTIIFVIPIGIVTAVSGIEPSLNTIAEIIGGAAAGGDTMTVQFFRMFGSEPAYHALIYSNDLKLSHYVKIPPRDMFWVQMWGGLIGTMVTVGQWNWLMDLPGVCTPDAPFRLICPGIQGDFSNFVFWGTLGAKRMFGPGSKYSILLIGFPLGVAIPIIIFLLKKKFKKSEILQSCHPLLLILSFAWGGHWGAYIPGIFINLFSWNYLKRNYLEFWTRYNYVTLAALGGAISINALLVFWALVFPNIAFPTWWGNPDAQPGCIGGWNNADCAPFKIPDIGYFGPAPGNLN